MNVVENARKDLEADMLRRRREMRAAGKTVIIPEDDPNQYKQALHKRAVKVSPSKIRLFIEIPTIIEKENLFHTVASLSFSSCLPTWSDYELKLRTARLTCGEMWQSQKRPIRKRRSVKKSSRKTLRRLDRNEQT